MYVGIFIVSSECQFNSDVSGVLLKDFVKNVHSLYSNNFFMYKIHSLLYLTNDVKKCGKLDKLGAFKFEFGKN